MQGSDGSGWRGSLRPYPVPELLRRSSRPNACNTDQLNSQVCFSTSFGFQLCGFLACLQSLCSFGG